MENRLRRGSRVGVMLAAGTLAGCVHSPLATQETFFRSVLDTSDRVEESVAQTLDQGHQLQVLQVACAADPAERTAADMESTACREHSATGMGPLLKAYRRLTEDEVRSLPDRRFGTD